MTVRPAPFQDVWRVVDGRAMYARASLQPAPAGAPVVVLVHGLGVSGRYMVPTLRHLAPDCRVWIPDLPGFGASAKPAGVLSLPELADALAAWMTAVDVERAVLVGNSLGCQVIAQLAVRHPARLCGAVLVSPTMDPAVRGPLGQLLRLVVDAPREAWPLPLIAVEDYLRAGPARTWRTLRDALRAPVPRHSSAIRVPAVVVRGERDPIVSQEWAERVVDLLPSGRLVVVGGAPHAVNFSAPEALAGVVRSLLAEVASDL